MRMIIRDFVPVLAVATIIVAVLTALDIWTNQWLYGAANDWRWYNYLTTPHGVAMLYIKYGWKGVLLPIAIIAAMLNFARGPGR